jgi:hypothetical protein
VGGTIPLLYQRAEKEKNGPVRHLSFERSQLSSVRQSVVDKEVERVSFQPSFSGGNKVILLGKALCENTSKNMEVRPSAPMKPESWG